MLRLRNGLGAGSGEWLLAQAILANVKVLQGTLAIEQTGVVDAATVAAVNEKLGTRHNAEYITNNAILLADKIVSGGAKTKWPVWKIALVGGGVLAAVFVVVKLSKGR